MSGRPDPVVLTIVLVVIIFGVASMFFAGRPLPRPLEAILQVFEHLRPKVSSWSRVTLDDHTSRLMDHERRLLQLEVWSEQVERDLFEDKIKPKPSQSIEPPPNLHERSEAPVASGLEATGEATDQREFIEEIRGELRRLRKNYHNSKVSDVDAILAIFDEEQVMF